MDTPNPNLFTVWASPEADALSEPAAAVRFAMDVPRGCLGTVSVAVELPDPSRETLDAYVQTFEAALSAGLVTLAGQILTRLGPDLARSVVDRLRAQGQDVPEARTYPDGRGGDVVYLERNQPELDLRGKAPERTSSPPLMDEDDRHSRLKVLTAGPRARGWKALAERLGLLGPDQTVSISTVLRLMGWAKSVDVDTNKQARALAAGWIRTASKHGALYRVAKGVYRTPKSAPASAVG